MKDLKINKSKSRNAFYFSFLSKTSHPTIYHEIVLYLRTLMYFLNQNNETEHMIEQNQGMVFVTWYMIYSLR